ncbi:unnamed protein product [Chrysodeixis includens]|uniref:Uncharacterized protein n=1 Tax=Chrysodeixis includens TaxID=689277 RepID=A0A9P0FV01_CHRIL|nr:unnamed protein product [Chrysodeixis includens]
MYKVFIFIAIYFAACYAAPGGVTCGYTPRELFRCLTLPVLVDSEIVKKCKSSSDQCGRVNCLYRESKWWSEDALDKVKFAAFLSDFAKKNPAWVPTVELAKSQCLGESKLLPQGASLDCPAFDITHCVYMTFLKHAAASTWSNAEDCAGAREYARSCPICPSDCFATAIPIGSCNACYSPPRF